MCIHSYLALGNTLSETLCPWKLHRGRRQGLFLAKSDSLSKMGGESTSRSSVKLNHAAPRKSNVSHVNVRSLLTRTRKKELEILTEMHAIDVLCLTETWLNEQHNDHLVHINGFQAPFRFDHTNWRGGVAVYLCHSLSPSAPRLSVSINHLEYVCLQLKLSSRKKN